MAAEKGVREKCERDLTVANFYAKLSPIVFLASFKGRTFLPC